ncbi:hypothetical protein BGZ95_004329 [Linnemannia exigua]|uniref:Uncharacterized protein n=1 Tax=Linnemannia exigua TaxID=604196 RepID=A0AAD4D350_9FUNG|nr:hypothetical protein BGZ95_004329 [Linnemannia exigua]
MTNAVETRQSQISGLSYVGSEIDMAGGITGNEPVKNEGAQPEARITAEDPSVTFHASLITNAQTVTPSAQFLGVAPAAVPAAVSKLTAANVKPVVSDNTALDTKKVTPTLPLPKLRSLEILSGVVHVYGIHIFKKTLHLCTWTVNQRVPLINVLETKYKLTGISGRP